MNREGVVKSMNENIQDLLLLSPFCGRLRIVYVNKHIVMHFFLLGCYSSNNCSYQGPNTCRPRRWHVRRVSNGEKFNKNLEKRFSICNSQEFIRWNYCGGNYDDCQSGIFDEFLSGLLYFTIAVKSVRN